MVTTATHGVNNYRYFVQQGVNVLLAGLPGAGSLDSYSGVQYISCIKNLTLYELYCND